MYRVAETVNGSPASIGGSGIIVGSYAWNTYTTGQQSAPQRLASTKAPWLTGIAGLSIIVAAFLISIVNASYAEHVRLHAL